MMLYVTHVGKQVSQRIILCLRVAECALYSASLELSSESS